MRGDEWTQILLIAGAVVFPLLLLVGLLLRKSDTPLIILKDLRYFKTPEKGYYVYLAGRPTGLLSWLRALFGMHVEVRFEATTRVLRRIDESVSVYQVHSVPLHNIDSCFCEYRRNPLLAILSALLILGGAVIAVLGMNDKSMRELVLVGVGVAGGGMILAIAAGLAKRLTIGVTTGAGETIGVQVKPGLTEGVEFTKDDLKQVLQIVQFLAAEHLREDE
jgi:hypothetical protein